MSFWRRDRGLGRAQRARIDELRRLAVDDPVYLRPFATELLQGATVLVEARRPAEAVPLLDELVALLRTSPAAVDTPDRMLLGTLRLLGSALRSADPSRAEPVLLETVGLAGTVRRAAGGAAPGPEVVTGCLIELAMCREDAGDLRSAREHLRHAEYALRTHEPSAEVWSLRGVVRVWRRRLELLDR